MSTLFDRLQGEMDKRESEGGITPLDLASLPAPWRKIMRTMLREIQMSLPDLQKAFQAMPEADRVEEHELHKSLDALVKEGWLIQLGEAEVVNYRVNLRRKAASKVGADVWGTLDKKIMERTQKKPPSGG